ncbi:MAG: outer membrane protein transport protein [Pseudomonadota bacterium]|nr:outer membrane protein transport protein [Pseudomonadota bacterium]
MKIQAAGGFPLILLASGALTAPCSASGFRIEGQDARACGAAHAGPPARAADAGFAVYNPATLAGVDRFDFSGTSTGLIVDSAYTNASGVLLGVYPTPGETSGEGPLADAYFPSMGLGVRLSNRLVVGMSLNAPFGLKSQYGPESALRYHAQTSELKTIAATPMAAFSVTPTFAVAAGLRIQYADLSITAASDASGIALASSLGAFEPGTEDVYVDFNADDFAVGFVAGLQAQLMPGLTFGVSYTSKIDHDFDGEAKFDLAGSLAGEALAGFGLFQSGPAFASLSTPALVEFGAVYSLTERLDFLASASLSRWSSFESIAISFENPAQPDDVLTQNWKDSWAVSVGAEYRATAKTTLRAGVMRDDSPLNDAFASPRIADADRLWLSAGVSRDLTERWSADVGGAVLFFEDRHYDLPGTLPETLFRGSIEATGSATAFILSARVRRSF